NKVTAERIEAGTDARTTIMIKNIPNKFTQAMLKDWIDETSADCYDFLYLRIDFQNKCNVGYAFVNFVEPRDIVTFSQRRVGASWNVFSSEKRCDISYANIQGRDKLIEKFRNSSVMDQDPAFRPKLFHTIGSLKGQEEAFPACNDPKKKARSTMDA
ncbi:RNA recognition motif 2-domain-containing protein, partial [Protomyces lactucae-debilis]